MLYHTSKLFTLSRHIKTCSKLMRFRLTITVFQKSGYNGDESLLPCIWLIQEMDPRFLASKVGLQMFASAVVESKSQSIN